MGVRIPHALPDRQFEELVLPHLDAAFNYAPWLTGNDAEAEDVVQDACVRAMRFMSSLRGENARAWLLTIVRNAWYSRFSRRGSRAELVSLDGTADDRPDETPNPEALMFRQDAVTQVRQEIAAVIRAPIGTVMSRLARA